MADVRGPQKAFERSKGWNSWNFKSWEIGGSPSKHTHTAMPLVSGRSNAGTPKLLRCIAVAMLGLT
jgi:hypothetical protein